MRRASYCSFLRRSLCVAMTATALFLASCGDDPTTPEPTPTPEPEISEVVEWMDDLLSRGYYWLDEYNEKHDSFDFTLDGQKFLNENLLNRMETNLADGMVVWDAKTQKYIHTDLYTSIVGEPATSASTRGSKPTVNGYGLVLSPYIWSVYKTDNSSDVPDYVGLAIDHVYPDSPAAKAGIKRGDMIMKVDDKYLPHYITGYNSNGLAIINNANLNNLNQILSNLYYNEGSYSSLEVRMYDEEGNYENKTIDIAKASYEENPVAHSSVLDIDATYGAVGKKIGYLSYLSFDSDFDQDLIDAISDLSSQGVTDMILDLRINMGGSVASSRLLASMLLDASHNGALYATLQYNPNNTLYFDINTGKYSKRSDTEIRLEKTSTNLGVKKLWVIGSEFTASASEMLIVGLRSIGIDVELIGKVTEGKDCGMEVNEKKIGSTNYTFMPINFMNIALGADGNPIDYQNGITPDVDFDKYYTDQSINSDLRKSCGKYPIPEANWGKYQGDIALEEAIMRICGKSLFTSSTKASAPRHAATRAGGEMLMRDNISISTFGPLKNGMYIHANDLEKRNN